MHRVILRLLSSVVLLSCLFAGPVWAQAQSDPQAASFDQLRMLVKSGDTVRVNNLSGRSLRGRIVGLSSSSLRIDVNGITHEFAQNDVKEIRQFRRDSLSNGATIGALIGGGFGVVLGLLICADDGDCDAGMMGWMIGAYTAFGAGTGVGVDALIVREKTIFRPAMAGSARLRVEPLIGQKTKGVSVVFSF